MSTPIESNKIFVVIPAYNEDRIIQQVVQDVLDYKYKVVVVDDGSSPALIFLKTLPIYFLRHKVNLGQGAALQTGIEFALAKQATYIVTFDGDGQHKASDIAILLKTMQEKNAEIVLGSRFITNGSQNIPASRKRLLRFARYVDFIFTGLLLTDAHNGLRLMNRKAAEAIKLQENRMAHATEILSLIKKKKLRYTEAPVHISYTDYSNKKGQTAWSSFRIFFDILLNKIFG